MNLDEARERAARGAALLDEKKPGWREKVDPETLEMASGGGCILGQVYGRFTEGLHLLGVDYEMAGDVWYGFAALDSDDDFVLLQDAWLELLGAQP